MPVIPALPKNRATSDPRKAATSPSDDQVSMVAAPYQALRPGRPMERPRAQTTTGEASVSDSHCQLVELGRRDHRDTTTGTTAR